MGQFHGQHDRAVLQRENVPLPRLLAGIDHTEHAQYLVARLGDRHDPIAVPHGPPAAADPGQQLGPIPRLRARVGARATRAGPGEQVAEAVLDRDGQPGEVVHRVGYPGRAASVGRHPAEDLVDPLALLQVRHGARELLVGRLEPCVEITQLHGAGPLPAVQARADQGRPGQLGQRRQQEPLVDRRLVVGRDDEVAGVPADGPHRKGPGPLGSGHLDDAVRPVELDQLGDDAVVAVRAVHPGVVHQVRILRMVGTQRADRADRQPQDLRLLGQIEHDHRQREHAADVRHLRAKRAQILSIVHRGSPTERLTRPRTSDGRVQEPTQLRRERKHLRRPAGTKDGTTSAWRGTGSGGRCPQDVLDQRHDHLVAAQPVPELVPAQQLPGDAVRPPGRGTRGARGTPRLAAGSGNGDPSSSVSRPPTARCPAAAGPRSAWR